MVASRPATWLSPCTFPSVSHPGFWSVCHDQVPTFHRTLLPESSRKKQSTSQKNESHALMEWVSSFLCHLLSYFLILIDLIFYQRLYERAYGKQTFWDPACLKISWFHSYIWLTLQPHLMFKILSLENFEAITLRVAIGHYSDSQCFIYTSSFLSRIFWDL